MTLAAQVENMEELARLRCEGDLREFKDAGAAAEAKPNGLSWLTEKAARKGEKGEGASTG